MADRRQATIVDGYRSTFLPLHAGVPQGAILSPLLFSVYMNDIPTPGQDLSTNLFADDTSVFALEKSPQQLALNLQAKVDVLCAWFKQWLLSVNPTKSAAMVIRSRGMQAATLTIYADSSPIMQVSLHRHLGVVFNETLGWSDHVTSISLRAFPSG